MVSYARGYASIKEFEKLSNADSSKDALITCSPHGIPFEWENKGNEIAGIPTRLAYTV